jgi:hypothetical protein
MPYYDVADLVSPTKTNLIHEMPCGYGNLRTTAVRIRHYISRRAAQRSQAAVEVSQAAKFDYSISHLS